MKILGLAAPFSHDSAAALIVDGKLVAAVEEERFSRKKHDNGLPLHSIAYCLKEGQLKPSEIDYVAFPRSIEPLRQYRWPFFFRSVKNRPTQAFKKLLRNQKEFNERKSFVRRALEQNGFDVGKVKIEWIEHQIAHAASAFYFSGMKEASIMSIDAGGEITSTLLARGEDKKIEKIKEIVSCDSLGNFYATMTDYLGFDRGEGEYKVMGMAPFGDASKVNFDHIVWWDEEKKTYFCNDEYIWVKRSNRARVDKVYSRKMVEEFGPERDGDSLAEPYIHIAAITQKKLEDITLKMIDAYLKDDLKRHGNLCFAGGCALNVAMNRKIVDLPYVKELWVQPAAHDAGGALGAAAYVARQHADSIPRMTHSYWGPAYDNQTIEEELKKWPYKYTKQIDICETTAQLIHCGEVVSWFQGRTEWGPRSLGNRSILGNPTIKGTADSINAIIKFREQWRPFCPSILEEHAKSVLGSDHPAPFMTIAFKATPEWKERIAEVVHVDGTMRPQIVTKKDNPRYHQLITNFYKKSGVPVLINTSLNRRGEPMICSPKDAMVMFEGSGLRFLAIGDYLVEKA